jgi:hypothetical protein
MSKWEDWKNAMGETRPWHLLDYEKHVNDESVSEKRMSICKSCPELIGITNQCKKCGCLMHLKTKLELASCPLGKW